MSFSKITVVGSLIGQKPPEQWTFNQVYNTRHGLPPVDQSWLPIRTLVVIILFLYQ